jgi:hypothetical protein
MSVRSVHGQRIIDGRRFLLAGRFHWWEREYTHSEAAALRRKWERVRVIESVQWTFLYVCDDPRCITRPPAIKRNGTLTTDSAVLDRKVTVCSKCHTAACWHGSSMCANARTAGTIQMTVSELHALGVENPERWFKDPATGVLDRAGLSAYLQTTGKSNLSRHDRATLRED